MSEIKNFNINETFQMAIQNHREGNIVKAKNLYSRVLELDPNHENANINIGVIFQQLGEFQSAKKCYENVLKNNSKNIRAYTNLGVVFKNLEKIEEAIKCFDKAIEISPDSLEAQTNLGVIFQELEEDEKALKCYEQVIKINPNNISAHNNIGIIFLKLGELQKAKKFFENATKLNPNYLRGYINLGTVHKKLKENNKALNYYKKAVEINPNYSTIQNDLGVIFQELGDYQKAKACYEKAINIDPNFSKAYCNLAVVLKALGENEKVLDNFQKTIELDPDNLIALNGIIEWLISYTITDKKNLKNLCLSLFKKNNVNHNEISFNARLSLIDQEIENKITENINLNSSIFSNKIVTKLIKEELFSLMLQKSIIADKFLEKLLSRIRSEALFQLNKENRKILIENLDFFISLAQQCWLNEYVYIQSEEETTSIKNLKNKLEKNQKIDELELVILGCYIPLNNSEIIKQNLLNYKPKNKLFNDLINLQIKEPLKENELAKSIDALGEITDLTSNRVKKQYEVNPYPRWRFAKENLKFDFFEVLNSVIKPNKIFDNHKFENPNVLIAGCGTGRDPISANIYKNANILGIDLSISSLAYAKRKTEELNYNNISYMHADILDLKKLNKKFDIIQSSGVLHHMNKPIEGLKVLLDILQPHGFLRLGLYSEIARQNVIEARQLIKNLNFKNNIEDIKKFRQFILNDSENKSLQKLTEGLDFYSTSTTRDLLFHVQEHRFTIPEISKILNDLNLEFIGFEISKSSIKTQYSKLYPDDKKNNSLYNWHQFEMSYPDTFFDMYQFWVRKK